MRAKKLTKVMLAAIVDLAELADAGAIDDTYGQSWETCDEDQRKRWKAMPTVSQWAKEQLDKRSAQAGKWRTKKAGSTHGPLLRIETESYFRS